MQLIFDQQVSLSGSAVELVGTEWQLVVEDSTGGDEKAATLVFVDDHLAVGTTACRSYVASYEASDERLDFRSTAMTEYGGAPSCAEESRIQEGQFTDDLSPASQYSVSEEEGIKRLRIRTGRGRTVTFKPLVAGVESVLDVEWHLSAFVTVSEWGGPDVVPLRVDRLIPGTEVTAGFHESGVAGFGGCNSYGARLEPEEPVAREDGSFAMGTIAIESTDRLCSDPPGVLEQEKRFTGLIPKWGVSYGFFWAVLGPMTLMPVLLGGTPQWTAEAAASVFPNLIGHLGYGAGLGITFYLLEVRYSPWWIPRTEVQAARLERRREQVQTSGPALWTLLVLMGLTLPVLLEKGQGLTPIY